MPLAAMASFVPLNCTGKRHSPADTRAAREKTLPVDTATARRLQCRAETRPRGMSQFEECEVRIGHIRRRFEQRAPPRCIRTPVDEMLRQRSLMGAEGVGRCRLGAGETAGSTSDGGLCCMDSAWPLSTTRAGDTL